MNISSDESYGNTNSASSNNSIQQISSLTEKIVSLEDELIFMKRLWIDHHSSMVCHMKIKKKNGERIWVNTRDISIQELRELDQDEEVKQWIQDSASPFDNKYYIYRY